MGRTKETFLFDPVQRIAVLCGNPALYKYKAFKMRSNFCSIIVNLHEITSNKNERGTYESLGMSTFLEKVLVNKLVLTVIADATLLVTLRLQSIEVEIAINEFYI